MKWFKSKSKKSCAAGGHSIKAGTRYRKLDVGDLVCEKCVTDKATLRFVGEVSTKLVGSARKFEFEVSASDSDEEINRTANDAMFETIEWWYKLDVEDKDA